jgi:two-component system KDP operon response regulator KdpE
MALRKHLVQIVDDDPASRRAVRATLEAGGFRVVTFDTFMGGERAAASRPPDAMIVSMEVTDREAIDLIRAIRRWSRTPILALSSRRAEARRLAAFDAGADDYILKPFSVRDLLARVHAALRFHACEGWLPTGVLELDGLSIDLARRTVRRHDGRDLDLTRLEYRLLETLVRGANRALTQAQIMTAIWGPNSANALELRVCVSMLRKKLENDPSRPSRIVTEHGVGYRLVI